MHDQYSMHTYKMPTSDINCPIQRHLKEVNMNPTQQYIQYNPCRDMKKPLKKTPKV